MFRPTQQTPAVLNKQIFPASVQEATFSIKIFQSIVYIQGREGHGGHTGECRGGQHPFLD